MKNNSKLCILLLLTVISNVALCLRVNRAKKRHITKHQISELLAVNDKLETAIKLCPKRYKNVVLPLLLQEQHEKAKQLSLLLKKIKYLPKTVRVQPVFNQVILNAKEMLLNAKKKRYRYLKDLKAKTRSSLVYYMLLAQFQGHHSQQT